jgi:hypothetical protein
MHLTRRLSLADEIHTEKQIRSSRHGQSKNICILPPYRLSDRLNSVRKVKNPGCEMGPGPCHDALDEEVAEHTLEVRFFFLIFPRVLIGFFLL